MLKQRLIIINPECLSLYFIISWPSNYYSISYKQKKLYFHSIDSKGKEICGLQTAWYEYKCIQRLVYALVSNHCHSNSYKIECN